MYLICTSCLTALTHLTKKIMDITVTRVLRQNVYSAKIELTMTAEETEAISDFGAPTADVGSFDTGEGTLSEHKCTIPADFPVEKSFKDYDYTGGAKPVALAWITHATDAIKAAHTALMSNVDDYTGVTTETV